MTIREAMHDNPRGQECSICGTFVDAALTGIAARVCPRCCHDAVTRRQAEKPPPESPKLAGKVCRDCGKPINTPGRKRQRCQKCQILHRKAAARLGMAAQREAGNRREAE